MFAIGAVVSMVATVIVLPGAVVAASATVSDSGYQVTVAARYCADYTDVTANRARNSLQETFSPLGADSPYPGAFPVSPVAENSNPAQRRHCAPLPAWKFTLGTGINAGSATNLSVVNGVNGDATTVAGPIHALSANGTWDGSSTIEGAQTFTLSPAQAQLAQGASGLWIQGGVPSPRGNNEGQLNGQQNKYAFASLRCAVDAVNGDNVEYIQYTNGAKHVYCFAYYVDQTETGTITITKQTTNNDRSTLFHFGSNVEFGNNGDISLKGGQSSADYVRAVTASGDAPWFFQEKNLPAGWSLKDLTCATTAAKPSTWTVDGAKVSISLTKGDHVTCTYTDTQDGTLVVHKTAVNGGSTQFPFLVDGKPVSITGNTSTSFTYDNLSAAGVTVPVTEGTLPEGWAQQGAAYCTVDGGGEHTFTSDSGVNAVVKPGQTVDCYFTNEFSEKNLGTGDVTVVKHITGGTAPVAGFPVDVTKAGLNGGKATTDTLTFTTDGQSSTVIVPTPTTGRAVTVQEQANPAGWTLTAAVCTLTAVDREGSEPAVGTTVTGKNALGLTVTPGQHWTCDYTNDRDTATLVLHKDSGSADGTFLIAPVVNGTPDVNVALATSNGTAASSTITIPVDGTTTIGARETNQATWHLADAYCTVNGGAAHRPDATFPALDESSITPSVANVGRGDKVDCYFVDGQNIATVVITKDVPKQDASAADGVTFTFPVTVGGDKPFTVGVAAGSSKTSTVVVDDNGSPVTVSEDAVDGWHQQSLVCSVGTPQNVNVVKVDRFNRGGVAALQGSGTLNPGEELDCAAINALNRASVTVYKEAYNADGSKAEGETFEVSPGGDPLTVTSFGGGVTFPVNPGNDGTSVTLTELAKDGWVAGGIVCDNEASSDTSSITLSVHDGDEISCVIANFRTTATVKVDKTADNGGDTEFGFTATAPDGADQGDGAFSLTDAAAPQVLTYEAGTQSGRSVSITESATEGWTQQSASCVLDGSQAAAVAPSALVVHAGDSWTCTFVNVADPGLPNTGGKLPQTGSSAVTWGMTGVAGLLVGIALMVLSVRRREDGSQA
jgi:LPXTG-motif cell wall-anchored protein